MISTRDLSGLPDIDALKRLLQSMAMLDAILSTEWEYRYYSFNSKWSKGEQMGSMRNSCGDDFFVLFNKHGCFFKGFDHEAEMSPYRANPKRVWPGVLDTVPKVFERGLNQPAFSMEDTTFCIWRQYQDKRWQIGEIAFPKLKPRPDGSERDPDGSSQQLSPLDGKPETYHDWAVDQYENAENLTLAHVKHVYAHKPLTAALVKAIDPEITLSDLAADIAEIGYPKRVGKK
jgi:hypothetical protein